MEAAHNIPWRPLGRLLVEQGLISEDELERSLAEQASTGRPLGETLVELGFVSRVDLAGVISEQWDELRLTTSGQKQAETQARRTAVTTSSVVEVALRERLEAVTAELALRDQRIAQQDATIAALVAQLGASAAA